MINNLIFQELVKRGYKLEGRTRVWNIADSKLWYLTSKQSKGFLDLEKDESYKKEIIDKEVSLIKENMPVIVNSLRAKSYNIIDVGCGNGKKASLFIEDLSKYLNIRYCPIDISSYMVKSASKTIRELNVGEVIELNWNISDFENLSNVTSLFRRDEFKHHFLLFLGNTMGNFSHTSILENLKDSMKKGDYLLIGNGVIDKNKDFNLVSYKSKHMDLFLYKVLNQLDFKRDEVEFDVRLTDDYLVEMFFVVKKNKTIKHLDKEITFKKGDVIVTAISYKYTKNSFRNILKKFFSKVKIVTSKDNSYALAFCIK